jgi:hypothetical protein
VCCKIAIQDFTTWLHKKNKKQFTVSPTDYNPSVFHRELKKNYGSVPQSLTESPTEYPHPEAHVCQTRVRRADLPMNFPTDRKV